MSEKSKKVSEIVTVITSIAERINLLALNATIEAARAGEAGKGFAVVAGEVKNLASQAGQAADEIGAQINDMQTATGSSVEAVMKIIEIIDSVSHTTTAIAGAVEEQSAATNEIASNIARASNGTKQISGEIVGVEDGADQTGNTARHVQDASAHLTRQCGELSLKMDDFLQTIRNN